MTGYPIIRETAGSRRFNLLMTIAQTEATAHELGKPGALERFERAFELLRRMEVFGVPSQARRDILDAGVYYAASFRARTQRLAVAA